VYLGKLEEIFKAQISELEKHHQHMHQELFARIQTVQRQRHEIKNLTNRADAFEKRAKKMMEAFEHED
jgi:hypothetical protein